jgi:hypothetical protein
VRRRINLLSHLDPEHRITDGLFEQAAALAPLLAALGQPDG